MATFIRQQIRSGGVNPQMGSVDIYTNMRGFKTDFLCASSSFLIGMGSVVNLSGRLYQYNASPNPDGIAISHDWRMVGQDMRTALKMAKKEIRSDRLRK